MTGTEASLLDIIASNVDSTKRWSVSINTLNTMMTLNKNDVTTALKNLEDERYIDQFPYSGTPDEVFGIRLRDMSQETR